MFKTKFYVKRKHYSQQQQVEEELEEQEEQKQQRRRQFALNFSQKPQIIDATTRKTIKTPVEALTASTAATTTTTTPPLEVIRSRITTVTTTATTIKRRRRRGGREVEGGGGGGRRSIINSRISKKFPKTAISDAINPIHNSSIRTNVTTTTKTNAYMNTCNMFSQQCLSYQLLTLISLLVMQQAAETRGFDIATCNAPLGMESGTITDAQITASSAHDAAFVGPQHARLKTDNNGGAWCPKHMVSNALKEYLQVDLLKTHVITAIRTQGRFGKGQGQEYTEAYVLEYWRPGFTNWKRWKNTQGKEILPGNINTYSEVENTLQPIIFASKIRIYPYGQYDRTVCLRAEIVGCLWEEGIVSYSIPKGVQRGMEVDLSDKTYDGYEQGDRYVDGLGQLVDGQKGKDNFRTDIHGFGKGYEWIGWRNDTPGLMGKPVEIIFEFDTVRNFSAIILHTNNMFTKDVQVFVHATVFFSIGGRYFSGEPVQFSYMPDTIMDHARDVTIKLHHRIGKYLKINLYFAVKWIMLSEISFISAAAVGNFTDEQEQHGALLPQDTREYPLQSNEYHHSNTNNNNNNNKNGGKMPIATTTFNGERNYNNGPQLIAPKPIDQEPSEENFIGVVIVVLITIIILLVVVILFVVSRTKRGRGSNVLDAFQYSFNPNSLGGNVDKHRPNGNSIKASVDDSDSIGKNSLYHEPFNVNMYTSGVNGYAAVNDLQCNMTPDYTDVPEGGYAVPHMQDYMPTKMSNVTTQGGYVNIRRTPPPPLSSIFPRPPQVPPPPMEKYYATTAIFKPIKGISSSSCSGSANGSNSGGGCGGSGSGGGSGSSNAASNTMSSKASSNLSSELNYDDNMGTMNSQSTAPMINPYAGNGGVGIVGSTGSGGMNSNNLGGCSGSVGGGGSGGGNSANLNTNDNMQFQRTRTYNFRSYPDNL